MSTAQPERGMLFGHPAGLYTLFFAEMWERFSFYGMRALLVFYMTKGFLGYEDAPAITVYGAYTALVYMTPFFGGMLADRLLGARWAVVLGGVLMALGQLMMTVPETWAFFTALALLIVGNGFFKPNISTIVASLYAQHSTKRDAGFTIFYMGINLGAAMSPLLCGYIGEKYGWHWGFGLATIGMLTGLTVFVMPGALARLLIMGGAIAGAVALFIFHENNLVFTAINVFVGISLLAAAAVAWVAIGRGGLPKEAGAPPQLGKGGPGALSQGMLRTAVVAGTIIAVPIFALLVSGFGPLRKNGQALLFISEETIKSLAESDAAWKNTIAVVAEEASKPAGLVLVLAGLIAAGYLGFETLRLDKIPRERMFVVLTLTFFVMLFFAFFEQAGSSLNLFTDRNVDRVIEPADGQVIGEADVGKTIELQPTQEQLGYTNGPMLFTTDTLAKLKEANKSPDFEIAWTVEADNVGMRVLPRDDETPPQVIGEDDVGKTINLRPTQEQIGHANGRKLFTIDTLAKLRQANKATDFQIPWTIEADNVGMRLTHRDDEIPASKMQSVNAIFIISLGLVFSALWSYLGSSGLEPSTPLKFALGLLQLGLGFLCFWYGAQQSDARGMVNIGWLLAGYLMHTTGELCISPVGLSMVTKLSPKQLVSTVMGSWFLATAFSQYLAAIIAQFTSVKGSEGANKFPAPIDTVHAYGDVFLRIAFASIISAVICFALVPLLNRWMHQESELS